MSSQLSASSHCLLQMFRCKFIILYYDDGAIENEESHTMTNARIIEISTIAQVSSRTTKQTCKRTRSTHAVKLSHFLVIFKEIIVAFFPKDRKEMLKTDSILTEKFLNAVQTAYTLHAELNRPSENRRQQSRA